MLGLENSTAGLWAYINIKHLWYGWHIVHISSDWLVYQSITYVTDCKCYRPALLHIYSHIINILLTSFACLYRMLWILIFPLFSWPARLGHKARKKTWSITYGPCTRLIRGISTHHPPLLKICHLIHRLLNLNSTYRSVKLWNNSDTS